MGSRTYLGSLSVLALGGKLHPVRQVLQGSHSVCCWEETVAVDLVTNV